MPWITVAIVACAIVHGDNNIPMIDRDRIATIEAQAFVQAATSHVPLLTLLAGGYVESRFSPTGSQRDRDNGWWGVMQIAEPSLRCWGRTRHDDPAFCTPEQLEARGRLLDPAWNIAHAARMLETAWERAHAGHRSRAVTAGWPGAYYWGSVPTRRRALRRYFHYVGLIRHGERVMLHRIQRCRT